MPLGVALDMSGRRACEAGCKTGRGLEKHCVILWTDHRRVKGNTHAAATYCDRQMQVVCMLVSEMQQGNNANAHV
eukprot:8838721-Lingulodinium_polyedra.AAC.1